MPSITQSENASKSHSVTLPTIHPKASHSKAVFRKTTSGRIESGPIVYSTAQEAIGSRSYRSNTGKMCTGSPYVPSRVTKRLPINLLYAPFLLLFTFYISLPPVTYYSTTTAVPLALTISILLFVPMVS